MNTVIVNELGCVYRLSQEGDLMYSPLKAGTEEPAWDEFDYVDHMVLMDDEPWIIELVNMAETFLREA